MTALTQAELLARLERYQSIAFPRQKYMDIISGHYILNGTIAEGWHELYEKLEEYLDNTDPMKAEGSHLDALCADRLIYRQIGDNATGNITFSRDVPVVGTPITVPIGTRVYAVDPVGAKVFFDTTAVGTIPVGQKEISIPAVAVVNGTGGNITMRAISQIYSSMSNPLKVTNPLPFSGGTANEDDESLRQRYQDIVGLPGLATPEMIERHLTDLDDVSEAKIISHGAGDVEIIVDCTTGTTTNTDITDELRLSIASGVQACGLHAGVATPSGNIVPVIDPISLDDADCAGGYIFVRPYSHVLAEEDFYVDYKNIAGSTGNAHVVVPLGTHKGTMVEGSLGIYTGGTFTPDPTDRAVSIVQKTFTANTAYDVQIGVGIPGYLYNIPTPINFAISLTIYATENPEAELAGNIETSITNWFSEYRISESVEWSDIRTAATIAYTASDTLSGKHQLTGNERPFLGVDWISDMRVSAKTSSMTRDGEIITMESDERARLSLIEVHIIAYEDR